MARKVLIPIEIAARLEALRGTRSWSAFIELLEAKLKPSQKSPLAFYFEKNLRTLGLNEDQVCSLCKRHSTQPKPLVEVDYLELVLSFAKQEHINITEQELRERFVSAGLEATPRACPSCLAYEGRTTSEDVLQQLLPEIQDIWFKQLFQQRQDRR